MKRILRIVKAKNKRIKSLKYSLKELRAEFKKNDAQTTKAINRANKEYGFWLDMVEKMRILQKETKAQLASIDHYDDEIWKKLGMKQSLKNKVMRNVNSIETQISKGLRN